MSACEKKQPLCLLCDSLKIEDIFKIYIPVTGAEFFTLRVKEFSSRRKVRRAEVATSRDREWPGVGSDRKRLIWRAQESRDERLPGADEQRLSSRVRSF
jgi:hypothetical protein